MDPKLGAHANASATTTCSRICEVHLGAASVLVANWQLEELLLREQQRTNRDHKKKASSGPALRWMHFKPGWE